MGIKNFATILKHANAGINRATYSDFRGQIWAIDASIFFFRFLHNAESKRPNCHLDGFYQLFMRLLKAGIKPILVFDGKAPVEKRHTLALRLRQKEKTMAKIANLQQDLLELTGQPINTTTSTQQLSKLLVQIKGSPNESDIKNKINSLLKTKKNIIQLQPFIYDDIRYLCQILSIPVIRAEGEADVMCAKLYLDGIVQAIMSEDSDILLYGGGRLIRKFNWTNEIEVLDLQMILRSLGINYQQFVDLAILSGTDYTTTTIPNIGPNVALEYIRKGWFIEQIIDFLQQSTNGQAPLPSEDKFPYQNARELIKMACQRETLPTFETFDFRKIQNNQLIDLMVSKCHYRKSTIANHINIIRNIYQIQDMRRKIKISLKNPA